MTIESAKAFYKRMLTDEAFRTQHQNAATDDERREILLATGYDFTPEEWEDALAQISESSNSELSDKELTAVSGGVWPTDIPKLPTVFPAYGIGLPFFDEPLS